ncbi:hypothetical protein V8C37DRAFT_418073 [Trichoderma ceciliae]
MFFAACLCCLLSLPAVRADGWDDFSNNLATDLTPFLSLFGEQITKQYLSESITTLDYFIFAMAPMGILTAVVSAIRVCGSPSLRAFIGRAQEGGGNAEAELCSSTSRDVCELYNNGGIARVFGRPKILEVVYDPAAKQKFTDGLAGIYTFRKFVEKNPEEWSGPPDDSESTTDTVFAPNLSLNVGIKRNPPGVFWAVAVVGMALQASVLDFAVVVTYYLRWEKGGNRPESYACPLTIVGTLLECSGIFFAHFWNQGDRDKQSTRENQSKHSSIYWVQPGGQVLGDQVFDPFCCSDHGKPLQQYITSWKNQSKTSELVVWAAVGTSVIGFVLQFVGLRGLHSAVSVAQLGVTMVMSAARAMLRMQRLKPDDNYLSQCPDEVVGHELDWLAVRIGGEDVQRDLHSSSPAPSSDASSSLSDPPPRHLWRFHGTGNTKRITPRSPQTPNEPNFAGKLLAYRTRLAQLTQPQPTQTKAATSAEHFDVGMVEVRENAQRLALAIESAVNTIFSKGPRIREEWKNAESMFWSFDCDVASVKGSKDSGYPQKQHTLYLELTRGSPETPWELKEKLELEGLLGLWVWSLKSDPAVEIKVSQSGFTVSRATEIPTRRIVSTNRNIAETDLKIWLGGEIPSFKEDTLSLNSVQRGDPSTIWDQETKVRFFGWHAAEPSHSNDPLKVWSASTNTSFLSLCAQEVFGSFIASILDIVDDIGDINIQGTLHLRLDSSLVSELVKLFTERQLGSKEDALLCVLPPMLPRLGMPSTESALEVAKRNANQHRRRGEWTQAETMLRWAWRICIEHQPHSGGDDRQIDRPTLAEEPTKQAAIALGELYRWAMRDNNDMKEFGPRGIKWLSAQKFGRKDVDEIIDRYNDIAEKVKNGNEISDWALDSAIKDRLTATLLYLTLSTSITNEDKGKELCSAAKSGWAEVVLALLELGAEPDFKDKDSRTALSQAAQNESIDTMKVLMDGGAFPNSADANHRTPLSYASEMGHSFAVKILLGDQRVEPDAKGDDGLTPLWWAVRNGWEAVVKLLLDSGKVDPDARDKEGQTPLWWAAKNGKEAVVKLLLDSGKVDPDAQDKEGRTPLWWAASNGRDGEEAVVKLL